MEAPSKRILTADVHDAILASNAPRHDFISDDLTARLQNVGSRIRKSVAEGYATPAASPLAQSPTKQHHNSPAGPFVPTNTQIMHSVFGSPIRFAGATTGILSPAPSPSPRKRAREDDRARDADAMDCCESGPDDLVDSDSDDDDVLITPNVVGGGFPNVLANPRPMRPLRRPRITQPVFSPNAVAAAGSAATVVVVQLPDVPMDYIPTVAHALHHRVPLPVTVGGGGDDFSGQV